MVGRLIKSAVRELLNVFIKCKGVNEGQIIIIFKQQQLYILHMAVYIYVPVEAMKVTEVLCKQTTCTFLRNSFILG